MSTPSDPPATATSLKKRKVAISAAIAEAARIATSHDSDSDSPSSTLALNTSTASAGGGPEYDNFLSKKPARVREKRSEVWHYFEVQEITNNGQTIRIGKCKNCPYYGKYSSSTSFMKDHLRKCKGIAYPGDAGGLYHDNNDTTPSGGTTLQEADVKADENNTSSNGVTGEQTEFTPHKARKTSRASSAHASVAKPVGELNFTALWEYVSDARRAKYPKALNALLEDLGAFESVDLKSLDYEQFEILGSLLKPAPQKSFLDLVYR